MVCWNETFRFGKNTTKCWFAASTYVQGLNLGDMH